MYEKNLSKVNWMGAVLNKRSPLTLFLFLFLIDGTFACATCNIMNSPDELLKVGMANPAAVYCEELGYIHKSIKTANGEVGLCILSRDNSNIVECEEWDFLEGKCGKEFSYCNKQGYDIETVTDGRNAFSAEYAVCVPKNKVGGISMLSEEKIPLTDLFNLSGRVRSSSLKPKENLSNYATEETLGYKEVLPSSFDWRNKEGKNWLTSVKDQGNCGSCWAFATVGSVESVYKISKNNSGLNPDLSEEYLVSDCSNAGSCCGGYPNNALDFIKSYGITDESCFPYTDNYCSCPGGACAAEVALYRGNVENSENILNSLRDFRDLKLKASYIESYYRNSPIIKGILKENPGLMFDFIKLIVKYTPALRYSTGDPAGKDVFMTDSDVSEIISFLNRLNKEAEERKEELGEERTNELSGVLQELKEQVSLFKGKSFSSGFRQSIYLDDGIHSADLKETPTCSCKYAQTSGDICSDNTCSNRCSDWGSRLIKIDNWGQVPNSLDSIKKYLIEKGPLAVVIGVNDKFGGYFDSNNIYRCGDDSSANHVVVIVGYNDTGKYWIIKNSWGSAWNEGGYFKLGYGECYSGNYVYYASINKENIEYCNASALYSSYERINKVVLNGVEKSTENSSIRDFTSTVLTNLNIGKTYTLYVEGYTIGNYTEYVKAWIDYNNDKKFDTSEEINLGYATFIGKHTFNKTFTVLTNATLTNTRMRIYLKYTGVPSPCENATYGEVEDYTVGVINDSIAPYLQISDNSTKYVKPGELVIINANVYDESEIVYVYAQIESPDENIITTIQLYDDGMHNDSASADHIYGNSWIIPMDDKDYYVDFIVADVQNNMRSYNNTYKFTTKNATNTSTTSTSTTVTTTSTTTTTTPAYCSSNSLYVAEYIKRVILNTGERVSNASEYSDYTGTIFTTLTKGQAYDLNVEGYTPGNYTEYMKAWIDFNHDQDFSDAGEEINIGNYTFLESHNFTKTFTMLADAASGNTRMRVTMMYDSSPSYCGNFSFGEVEDYTIVISETIPTTSTLTTTSTTGPTITTTTTTIYYQVYATRDLPSSANAGTSFNVSINLDVDESNKPNAIGISEIIPEEWNVSTASNSGVYFVSDHKIEWLFWSAGNPVQDTILGYTIIPPAGFNGTGNFTGTIDYGGSINPSIGGDAQISILQGCPLQGDLPPCGQVTLSEVVGFINKWAVGQASLSDVVALINAWATIK